MTDDLTTQAIALALQGDANGRSVLAPGPGHSRKDRSLSVRIDPSAPDGFVAHSFAGDDWRECRDHVKRRLGIRSGDFEPKRRTKRPAQAADDAKRVSIALALWDETEALQGTLAERYLDKRKCVVEYMSEDLRFHPETWHKPTARPQPAMIALMRDIRTNAPCGIHRTFLNADATKLDRMMLGRAKGACVKLTEDADVTSGLGIAEGIETALSVMRDGFRPMWACLSAGTIENFPALSGIQCLTVFADADQTGIDAARTCISRWRDAGCEANALHPAGGGDYNDGAKP
jgi:putative DNA primase/helicase